MIKNPDPLASFDAALARLQSKTQVESDRQKPIVQRRTQPLSLKFSDVANELAVSEAANALASLWKTRR